MNLPTIKKITLLALSSVLLLPTHSYAAEGKAVKPLKVHTNPKVIEKVDADYPGKAARRKYDGWAILDLDVAEDGSVEKVYIKDSFGAESFSEAAEDAAMQWQFKPKNTPTKQYVSNIKIDFIKSKKGSASKSFGRKHKDISQLLAENKLDQALESLNSISFDRLNKIQEINATLSLWATYGQKTKDKQLQLHYLSKINLNKSRDTPDYMFFLLKQEIILQMGLNQLVEAKSTFAELKKLKPTKPHLPAFKKAMAQIDALAQGNSSLAVPGRIINHEIWRHSLARNQFSVTAIQGKLEQVSLRCSNGVKTFGTDKLKSLSVPKRWSNCYVDIAASNGTSFELVELPKN